MQTVEALGLISCVCACMCVCLALTMIQLWRPEVNIKCLPLSLSTLFLRHGLFLTQALDFLARLVSQWDPEILLSCLLPSSRIMDATVPNFSRCWGSKRRSWFLHFAYGVISPSPMLWYISWFIVYYIRRSSSLPIRVMMLTRIFVIPSQGVLLESETECWVLKGLAKSSKPVAVFTWKCWKNMYL